MGYALAEEALKRGAEVTLVSGPVSITCSNEIKRINILSAEEMKKAIFKQFDQTDILIMTAAVADYKPKVVANQKIKKGGEELKLELVKTDDILKSISAKKKNQFVVGFALETNDEKTNAKEKLVNKNLDVVVLNSLNDKGAGFGHDTNKVTIITKNDEQEYDLKSKSEVASDILNHIEKSI